MGFIIRGVEKEDLSSLMELAKQFTLINLPPEKNVLAEKIDVSVESFAGRLPMEKAEYIFVVEDIENRLVVGSSQIIAKHGTVENPHSYFKVIQKNRMSDDLGIGFMHKVLRFEQDEDGGTEIGGLLVDRGYRRRPEKVGRQVSLTRFNYMSMHQDRFTDKVHCELAPPLTEEGRSEFWEALGRRFTGMPYQEADQLSQLNKEFIRQLFPEEDIYLSLLDSKARLVVGRVGPATEPAKHLLEKIGFRFLNEIDPFDGGPHYGAKREEISVIRNSKELEVSGKPSSKFGSSVIIGVEKGEKYRAMWCSAELKEDKVRLPEPVRNILELEKGQKVCVTLLD